MDLDKIQRKLKEHSPSILGHANFSKYAVLLPLIEKDGMIQVLFEVRSHQMRRQPGEICFPGGRMDQEDSTDQDTAIRETEEELGIMNKQVVDVFPLDYLVSPFGMIVYPHVGYIANPETIKPNPAEVDEVFHVPLSFFLNNQPRVHYVHTQMQPEENFPFDLIPGGKNYNWRTGKIEELFYVYGDKIIWGMTAKILTHFTGLLQQ